MATTKSDLEASYNAYHSGFTFCKLHLQENRYAQAVELASTTFPHLEGMIHFEKKYNKIDIDDIGVINLIIRFAPVVLDIESLSALEIVLLNNKRIKKIANRDYLSELEFAKTKLYEANRLWMGLENRKINFQADIGKTLGGDQDWWRWLCECWELAGLIHRVPQSNSYKISLASYMHEVVSGKCPTCGACASGKQSLFWDSVKCPKCTNQVYFVFSKTL
ncbi:MAG: hypothetical protein QM811_05195 [Pirellulales bacterium]